MTIADWLKKTAAQKAVLNFLQSIKRDRGKMQFLLGMKTYIVAALLILLAAVEFIGIDVPGFDLAPQETIAIAVGLIFARTGAKTEAARVVKANDLVKPKDVGL